MKQILAITVACLLFFSCKKNNNDPGSIKAISDSYQGGKVAYILQAGDPGYDANVEHALIAATGDQSTGIMWYNGTFTTAGVTAEALDTGNANTNTIVTATAIGGFSTSSVPASFYWSSCEVVAVTPPNAGVFWVSFFDGGNGQVNKNDNTLSVRAVRSF